jgi:hypothetical protein
MYIKCGMCPQKKKKPRKKEAGCSLNDCAALFPHWH